MNVEQISIESDERGFELHVLTTDEGRMVFNIHAVAGDLYDAVMRTIGPWVFERDAARCEYDTGLADDPTMQPLLDRIKGRVPVTEPCPCWNDPDLAPRGLYCRDCQSHQDGLPRVDLGEAFDNVYKMLKENR